MGLRAQALSILKPFIKGRILCLSYPDLVMPPGVVQDILGVAVETYTDHGKWHRVGYRLAETTEAFTKAGAASIRYVDVHASRGCEDIIDLNEPTERILAGWYDLVIDPGTLEHCFNIGQAWMTAARSVGVGGVIFHTPPVTMVNHGFYGIQPTAMYDFYSQNGWAIEALYLADHDNVYKCPRTARVEVPPEMSLYCAARRLSSAKLVWPTQSKYLKHPHL